MNKFTKPSKEAVRVWLTGQVASKKPVPSPEEIRRQLGWKFNLGAECAR